MKVLLTGCKGLLGTEISRVWSGRYDIIAHDIDLDIADINVVEKRVRETRPDLVVNAAAYTDTEKAERDERTAYAINALGPQNLAVACQKSGVALMHISTDYVFSGDSTLPYDEFDRPEPKNVYGKSKYAGECYVRRILNKYYICRTSWLFGLGGDNFVQKIIRAGMERESIRVVDDQKGSPTYTRDLANKLMEIVERGQFGIYHVCNNGSCTWFQFACNIVEMVGIDTAVVPVSTEEFKGSAPRPRYSVLNNLFLEQQGIKPMRHHREALEYFIKRDLEA